MLEFSQISFRGKVNKNLINKEPDISDMVKSITGINCASENSKDYFERTLSKLPKKNTSKDNQKKGLDKYFAGFSEVKDTIRTTLIQPILNCNDANVVNIPSSMLIYGSKKQIKNCVKGIQNEIGESVDIHQAASPDMLAIKNELIKAKQRYLDDSKRTILIVNNAEKLLSVSLGEAEVLGIGLTSCDKEFLKNKHSNINNVTYFKALLDIVANTPQKDLERTGYATTLVFTTKYPHLIHPDLTSRNGKMKVIMFEIPQNKNIKEIILNSIKKYCKNAMVLLDKKNWQMILDKLNPNEKLGGCSANVLKMMIKECIVKQKNTEAGKELNLSDMNYNHVRDVSPDECKEFFNIEKFLNSSSKANKETLDILIRQKEIGLGSTNTDFLLSEYLNNLKNIQKELQELELRGMMTQKLSHIQQQIIKERQKIESIL